MKRRDFLKLVASASAAASAPALAKSPVAESIADPTHVHSSRKLLSNYTGPLFRVRRSSDNVEMDVHSYDEAAQFAGEDDDVFICQMYDQTGGESVTYPFAASQPSF